MKTDAATSGTRFQLMHPPETFTCTRNVWDTEHNCCKVPVQKLNNDATPSNTEVDNECVAVTMTEKQFDMLPMLEDVVIRAKAEVHMSA